MFLRFLGTGAADTSPLIATEYRDRLDKTLRRCASVLVNAHLLIDCGPHALDSMAIQEVDPSGITDLFLTHLHADHYRPDQIERLASLTRAPLRVWYREGAPVPGQVKGVEYRPLPLLTETAVSDGITVTALPANHTSHPVHYLLTIDGKRLFYGCDGAWMLNATYYRLRDQHLTACILDATVGDVEDDWRAGEHNS